MRLAVIVAAAANGVIGAGNALPWHLPQDLRYFKRVTMGKPIVMGRRTFESIGRALPGRTNIVISRDPACRAAGARLARSLELALQLAREVAARDGVDEVVVIGGAAVYAQALPLADRLYMTEVHAEFAGDVFLPAIAWREWREVARERHAASGTGSHDYSFVVYERLAQT
ncbi:MAG: dihydrofolate reductase [Halioglobus sp.]|nr:dihydrofolate reductase [Halioglobus sp.]